MANAASNTGIKIVSRVFIDFLVDVTAKIDAEALNELRHAYVISANLIKKSKDRRYPAIDSRARAELKCGFDCKEKIQ